MHQATQEETFQEACYLVVVFAPDDVDWGESNLRINEFLDEPGKGVVVNHDHFRDPNGGYLVVHVRTSEELAKLQDAGPLAGWKVDYQRLWASVTATGFLAQGAFTMKRFGGNTPAELAAAEADAEQYWWRTGKVDEWVEFAYSEDRRWAREYGWSGDEAEERTLPALATDEQRR